MLGPSPTVEPQPGTEKTGEKVDICHVPPGNPENAHVISVSVFALPAHWAHGDYLYGPCGGDDQTQT